MSCDGARGAIRRLGLVLLALAIGLGAAWAWLSFEIGTSTNSEEELERAVVTSGGPGQASREAVARPPEVNWAELESRAPGAVAWLMVPSLGISEPVMDSSGVPSGFYLSHGANGESSMAGVPFLDPDCTLGWPQVTIYGHHVEGTLVAFSQLADAWKQDRFDEIGVAWLLEPGEGGQDTMRTRLMPAFAKRTDEGDRGLTTFSAVGTDGLRTWLASRLETADAADVEAPGLIGSALSEVTLVTCSDAHAGQSARCAVTFVAVASA